MFENMPFFKILNLKIEDAVYGGFFAHVGEGASIENLGIESGSVTGEEYAAGIAAYAKGREILIDTCYNNYGPYQHVEKFIPRQILPG